MTVTTTAEPAVIATCDRCGERSSPMDPVRVEAWAKTHEMRHDREDRRARMEDHGHVMKPNITLYDCDAIEGTVSCSCGGWQSSQMKSCWFVERFDDHLREIEAAQSAS